MLVASTSAFVPASRAFMPARRIGRLAAFDLADTAEIAPAAADAGADAAARIAALEAQLAARSDGAEAEHTARLGRGNSRRPTAPATPADTSEV